jgi:hypothetical protein
MNKNIHGASKGLGRFQATFNKGLEYLLAGHLKLLESRFFGMRCTEIRELAYQLAEKNGVEHRFSHEIKMAGWDWVVGFKNGNPDICMRKEEATSAAHAMAFNKPQITKFFYVPEDSLKRHNISPTRIYKEDESSLSTVQEHKRYLHKLERNRWAI